MCVFFFPFCKKEDIRLRGNTNGLLPKLSDYRIFKGAPSDLVPNDDFHLYELATSLFTDYSEKQRLIKLPPGTMLVPSGDGLPQFPDGTILVKTFYYYHDKRDLSKGKRILETRILLKYNSTWSAGTYVWNPEQTEAVLFDPGLDETVNWIDQNGKARVISYHIPNKNACVNCHQFDGVVLPIGLKFRNLNREVLRNNIKLNQLQHFQDLEITESINPSSFSAFPNWEDPGFSLEERSRAYMDVNCAHCHNSKGLAFGTNLYLNYELSAQDSRISQKGTAIINQMETKRMPRLGTTIIDEEGLALLKSYLKNGK